MSRKNPPTVLNRLLAGILLGLVILAGMAGASAQTNVTPAQYLADLTPKPNFAPNMGGLPRLCRFGYSPASNTIVELSKNWGYALELGEVNLADSYNHLYNFQTPGLTKHGLVQLAISDPATYQPFIYLIGDYPTNTPQDIFVVSNGVFWNGATNFAWPGDPNSRSPMLVTSPASPSNSWAFVQAAWSNQLYAVATNIGTPIKYILNQGERNLDVPGDRTKGIYAWKNDSRVPSYWNTNIGSGMWCVSNDFYGTAFPYPATWDVTAQGQWGDYAGQSKAYQLGLLYEAVRGVFPNRTLYTFYKTDVERTYQDIGYVPQYFTYWGWRSDYLNDTVDIPSFEHYYQIHWTNSNNHLFSDYLKIVSYDLTIGKTNWYSWVSIGYEGKYSDVPRYTGFLKLLYTGGTIGVIPGMYESVIPTNPLTTSFPSYSPPPWIQDVVACAHVHAFFTHYANFLTNGNLLAGPQHNFNLNNQPNYYFTNSQGNLDAYVMARKLRTADQYLLTAWTKAGPDTNVTVNIPGLGEVTVNARDVGSVYLATPTTLILQDTNGLYPSMNLKNSQSQPLSPPTSLRAYQIGTP